MDLSGISANVFRYKYKNGVPFYLSPMSDFHLFNPATNEKRIIRQLDEAKSLGSRILLNGDIIDGIMPSDMKRYVPSVIPQEAAGRDDLINATIEYVFKFLSPYAENIDEMADGNHESAILKHHHVDIIDIVVEKLNAEHGTDIKRGKYLGWITYLLGYDLKDNQLSSVRRYTIFRSHGRTRTAEVTKGIMEFSRLRNDRVNLQWLGHSHDVTLHPEVKFGTNNSGMADYSNMWNLRTGGYLQHSKGSYPASMGLLPKPHTAALIQLNPSSNRQSMEARYTLW